MPPSAKFFVTSLLALASSGCAAGYLLTTYQGSESAVVSLTCKDAYRIYERRAQSKILVRLDPAVEAVRMVCGATPRAERARAVVVQRLADTERSACQVVSQVSLSPLHEEFVYACPAEATVTRTVTAKP